MIFIKIILQYYFGGECIDDRLALFSKRARAVEEGVCTEDIVPDSRYGTKATGLYIAALIRSSK